MDLRSQSLTARQRELLSTKAEQATESGDAALTTAGILAAAVVVGFRLLHESVAATVLLAVPMLASGIIAYLSCRHWRWKLGRDLQDDAAVLACGRAAGTRLEARPAGSFLVRLPERKIAALNRGAGLRSLLVRPDPNTFFGNIAYAPHSGQLLGLIDRRGRPVFDAHEQDVVDAYEEEFSKAS